MGTESSCDLIDHFIIATQFPERYTGSEKAPLEIPNKVQHGNWLNRIFDAAVVPYVRRVILGFIFRVEVGTAIQGIRNHSTNPNPFVGRVIVQDIVALRALTHEAIERAGPRADLAVSYIWIMCVVLAN